MTGSVSSLFQAIPSMPESHGSEYVRSGSKGGDACASMRLAMFGMRSLSSSCTQPWSTYSAGKRELSVATMMSRSIPLPWDRRPWILAKNSSLELTSSK